jgi:uncharacterized protein (TIGR00255 family)
VIRSMTGFAALSREGNGEKVTVTIKSVNHRFLDVQLKAPQMLGPVESHLRALVQQRVSRGRIEVQIGVEMTVTPAREVTLDEPLLARLTQLLADARARGLVVGELTASDVLRIPQLLDIRLKSSEPGPAALPPSLSALLDVVVGETLDALVVMRATEGRFIQADLDTRLATISGFVSDLERIAREGQASLEARLRQRLAELPPDIHGDPAAIAQETVRFVARSDVDEEIVRMRGHAEHWRGLSDGPEPCGRKLDFLVQEMNREINTIGSKVEGARATEVVIAAKAELERLREQVQNVE